MANYDKLIEIDGIIKQRYPDNVVLDGIINFEKFNKIEIKPKILWILKETHVSTSEAYKNGVFELNASLDENITLHANWKSTWGLVMEISDAIIHDAQIWEDEVPLIERLLKEEVIKQIAIINVKKTGGGAESDQSIINEFYQKDKDIIMAQIEAISPDIIINASRVNALFDDLRIIDKRQINQFDTAKFKNGIIINAYHPNQRNFSHKQYFELVRDCIKAMNN